jgi:HK97 family phage major capsid protein
MEKEYVELQKVKDLHADLAKQIDTKINEAKAQGMTEDNPLYKKMTADLADVKKGMDNMTDQIKELKAKHIPGSEGHVEKFSFFNTAKALVNIREGVQDPWSRAGAGLEKELMDARMNMVTKVAATAPGSNLGFLIPIEPQAELVNLAIANCPIMKFNVKKLTGLTGDVTVARLTTRGTSYHVGENAAPTAEAAHAVGQIVMRPHEAAGYSVVTDKLLQQTSNAAEELVREQLSLSLALEMEQNGFISGTGTAFQPLGLLATANTALYTASTAGNTTTAARCQFDNLAAMIGDLETANELEESNDDSITAGTDPKNMGFLMHPNIRQGIFRDKVRVITGAAFQAGFPLMIGQNILMNNQKLQDAIGYPVKTTTLMPTNVTVGGSATTSPVLFANWRYFYVGLWGDMKIKTSDQASDAAGNSAFLNRLLMILVTQMYDCAVVRPTAFTLATGMEATKTSW